MQKVTSGFLVVLALAAGACAATTHDVTVTVTPRTTTVDAPDYIGAGDRLRVNVQDSTYANRYVVRDTGLTLTALDASAMAGDTSLKVMNLAFAPSTVPAAPGVVGSGRVDFIGGEEMPIEGARSNRVLLELNSRQLETVVDSMNKMLERLRARVRADRGEYARITLLADTSWFTRATAFANDSAAKMATAMLYVLADARQDSVIPRHVILPGASDSVNLHTLLGKTTRLELLTPTYLFSFRSQLERYGRRLDLFRAALPADPPAALSDTSSVPNLMATIADLSEEYDRLVTQRTVLDRRVPGSAAAAPARPQMLVVGLDLAPVLVTRTALLERVDTARIRLDRVNRSTVRVVTAANQLPRWTIQPDPEAIFTSVYPAEKEVRVVVTRRNRFAPWGTAAAAGAAAETKPAATTTSSGGTTVTTVTTVTQGTTPAAAPAASGGAPAAATMPLVVLPRSDDTVAVLAIPVLQRYRFRLGAGMIFSSLRSPALETIPGKVDGDTGVYVQRVGRNEHRFVPVALLSTTLYPFEGRFVDGRARRYPFRNPSLSLQTGISLQNPTEHLYAGLAIEPMPGIEIGGGLHFGYVETTRYASGDFVPLSQGSATASRWKTAWAGTVTLDASTFVRAFGSLLGL